MKSEREPSKIKSDILLRVRLLYVLFMLAGAIVLVRLVWVQRFSRETAVNAGRLSARIFTRDTLFAQRGDILARDGEPLAISLLRYQASFDFASEGLADEAAFREQSDSLAKLLALFFRDRSAAEYARFFRSKRAEARNKYTLVNPRDTVILRPSGLFARLMASLRGEQTRFTERICDTLRDHTPVPVFPRDVDYTEWQTLREYPLLNWNMGMVYRLEEHDRRIYPQGGLARRTIGRTGDQGNYGIELACSLELAGTNGRALRQRIARGFRSRVPAADNVDPVDGLDVVTTLDLDLQDVADKALRQQLETHNAIWGTTIVMEVQSGEVLALVNLGRDGSGRLSETDNFAMTRRAEPGSTFKLATMIALLEDAGMPMSTVYDTGNGRRVTVGGAPVQDSHAGHAEMDFKTAAAQSSNVYFAKAVWERYADDKQRYTDFLRRMRLDRTVGFEGPAFREVAPYFPDWKTIGGANQALARLGFGYVVELTPMQMATFYNAVANGGRMVAPRLVRELRRDDQTVKRFRTETLAEKICSDATLRKVRECLEEVCRTGTGANYFRDTTLFRAAGKTGTAQYAQGGIRYGDGYYMGSMAVYIPAENPRYTIYTTIHTRRQAGKAYYGGPLSGPVNRRIARYIYDREQEWHGRVERTGERHYPVRVKGGDIAQVREVAKRFARGVESDRRTGWGRARVDSLSRVEVRSLADDPTRAPDVRGMGLKDALFLLESRGLRVRFSGTGAVTQQSVAPGTRIAAGQTVTIRLE